MRSMMAKSWFSVAAVAAMLVVSSVAVRAQDQRRLALKRTFDTEGRAFLSAFTPVADAARMSVVRLERGGEPAALGTVVSADGRVLTKASEVRDRGPGDGVPDAALTAVLADGQRVGARVLGVDRGEDLALVQVDADGLTPVEFALDAEPRLGQWLIVPGLDELPEAVGVLSSKPRRVHGVRLGISFGERRDGRIVIGATLPGMGAAEAGLRGGDVLVAIGGQEVSTVDSVIDALRDVNAGDTLDVVVERRGRVRSVPVEMRLRPIDENNRTDRMNTMGNDLSTRRDGFDAVIQHDATIAPEQCGGPLLDLDGRCIGINIARAGRVEAYALPADVVVVALAGLSPEVMVHDPEPAPVGVEQR
ncbi:MAG: trypsin-like peptidase domain-containing protein [Planctomycetota bacterium]